MKPLFFFGSTYFLSKNNITFYCKKTVVLFFLISISIDSYSQKDTIAKPNLKVKLGGALRYNYNNSSWKPNQQKRGGDFGFEVFRLNADVTYGAMELHMDQRTTTNRKIVLAKATIF